MDIRRSYAGPKPTKIVHNDSTAVAYITRKSETEKSRAMCFQGKRAKPTHHYVFKNDAAMETFVTAFFATVASNTKTSAKNKTEDKAARDEVLKKMVPGAILYTSWGYDQTNVEWFQIISAKGCTITLQELAHDVKDNGYMSGTSTPVPDSFLTGSKPFKKILRNPYGLKISSCRTASLWDGTPKHCSWGA